MSIVDLDTLINDKNGVLELLAERLGATEAALRLLLTIIAGYPIAALYRYFIVDLTSKSIHHLTFVIIGFALCIFNYGFDSHHSLTTICVTYLIIRLLHNAPLLLIIINFCFHMSYLMIGYYFTESINYDIVWTMPHCVLVLRMIGLCFDIYDGLKEPENLSKEQQENAIRELPSLLEIFAFAYFPFTFLVGPQFPFNRYKRFMDGEFRKHKNFVATGIKRMLVGVLYLILRQVGVTMLPDDYFLSEEYRNQAFIMRLIYIALWGKFSLYKYISCWLLVEGSLICIGFCYAGKTETGEPDWYGCSNVQLLLFECGSTMNHYIKSFNVNTNNWVAQYVYKRLKPLNNRTISHIAVLVFLALWHGFHSGYYMTFLLEYLTITTEKQMEFVYKTDILPRLSTTLTESLPFKCLKFIALKIYTLVYMGWCLTPFIFLRYDRWLKVFAALYYFGFIYIGSWILLYQIYMLFLRPNKKFKT